MCVWEGAITTIPVSVLSESQGLQKDLGGHLAQYVS